MTAVPCCQFTRRQLLKLAAVAASTSLLPVIDPPRAYARKAAGQPTPVPHNLELVTLTETSAVFTWYTGTPGMTGDALQPAPADTEILLGTSPSTVKTVYHRDDHTPYHYAEVHGLEPGRTYFYEARSGGIRAASAPFALGSPLGTSALSTSNLSNPVTPTMFTVPHPPPGRHLFSIALANDLHIGETVAGLATTVPGLGGLPPGVSQVDGEPPYAVVTTESMVADARARHADLLIVAGDVSSEARPADLATARRALGRFGRYEEEWFVARGNHDRTHAGAEYASCRPAAAGGATAAAPAAGPAPGAGPAPAADGADDRHDCFDDRFFESGRSWFSTDAFGMHLVGLDTYDKTGNGGDNGKLSAEQYDWFAKDLAAHRHQPTLVFGHHPVTLESTALNVEPVLFDLDPQQAQQIEQLYAKTPGVFFHHSGHTHRNKRTVALGGHAVTFQEVAATKEYPCGFTLLRIFEGGYAVNFYKARSDLAREWSERTRQDYFQLYPLYTLGNFGDRNYVVARDMSGLRAAR